MRLWKIFFLSISFLVLISIGSGAALADVGPYADWWAEYYNNPHLYGDPIIAVPEAEIDNDWGYQSPRQGIPSDRFSVRWSANIDFEGGDYTFRATVDDGVRLWVDGVLLIDEWHINSVKTFVGRARITPGVHHVQMAYYEAKGEAVARLTWRLDPNHSSQPAVQPLPTHGDHGHYNDGHQDHGNQHDYDHGQGIIVDNRDSGFTWGGPSNYRHHASGGHSGNYYWTYNTYTNPDNSARWTPRLHQAGNYEVYVYIPAQHASTTNLRYRVFHNGKRDDVFVNQAHHRGSWHSLGRFYFNGHNKGHEYVAVYDNTRENYASRYIAFDAMKFVRTGH